MVIGGIMIAWAGIQMLATAPLVGAAMAIGGGIYLTVVLRLLARLTRSVTSAGPKDDIGTAVTEPIVDYQHQGFASANAGQASDQMIPS
jgi:hypothetical protein